MHSGFALAEKVGEVLGVELAEAASIVDGLAYDEHGGEGGGGCRGRFWRGL